jgi:hypothetical protein
MKKAVIQKLEQPPSRSSPAGLPFPAGKTPGLQKIQFIVGSTLRVALTEPCLVRPILPG